MSEYRKEYILNIDTPFYIGNVFVIDDETRSTMLMPEEY